MPPLFVALLTNALLLPRCFDNLLMIRLLFSVKFVTFTKLSDNVLSVNDNFSVVSSGRWGGKLLGEFVAITRVVLMVVVVTIEVS